MMNVANLWSSWELSHWNKVQAFQGMNPRQRGLLDLEACYFDTQHAHKRPWYPRIQPDPDTGKWRVMLRRERDPGVKLGYIRDKIDKVLARLYSEGKHPTIDDIDDATKGELTDSDFAKSCYQPGFDLLVKGSGCLSFVLLTDGRPEWAHLDPVWCEPVFVSRAASQRAKQIADEIRVAVMVDGTPANIDPGTPEDGAFLPVPEGAKAHDLCFLRFEMPFHDQLIANEFGEGQRGITWRRRRDYFLNFTVVYQDQQVTSTATSVGGWRVQEVIEHGFGFVPAEWTRSKGARDGELEGPSFISEPVRSMSEAADYMFSQRDDSVAAISWPKLVTVNLKDRLSAAFGGQGRAAHIPAGSEDALEYQNTGAGAGTAFLLEPVGTGISQSKVHIDDLKMQVDRVSGVPEHDPQLFAGTMSGTALRQVKEPLVAVVTDYRESLSSLTVGLVRKYMLAKKRANPKPKLKWPPVIAVTPDEIMSWATALGSARTSGLISQETAVAMFAKILEVPDLDAKDELVRIQADEDKALEAAVKTLPPEVPPQGTTPKGPPAKPGEPKKKAAKAPGGY